ncbi:MAG: glutaredoxin family protein [Chloroflexi bacterium]|nr:MAG: glutaredoxin family protein [Chloroflexota bacterium]
MHSPSMPLQITLYSRPGCHLCEEVHGYLEEWTADLTLETRVVDITQDEALFERFRYWIPVVDVAGGPLLYPPFSRDRLRATLEQLAADAEQG